VKGIAERSISWNEDDDFGYRVAEAVPDLEDEELLQPRRLYERQGRMQEYRAIVDRLKAERIAHLEGFRELTPEIVKAVG
jgi:phosphoenolpyruvate carboxykinase (ATP)